MRLNLIGAFIRNNPFGSEIAFKKGFEQLGEHSLTCVDPSCSTEHLDENADATIVFNYVEGEYAKQLSLIGGKKFIYQSDDLRFDHVKNTMLQMLPLCQDGAFTFDVNGVDLARQYGYKNSWCVKLTADNELYRRLPKTTKDIDACFIGSLSGGPHHKSRVEMCDIVSKMKGVKFIYAAHMYDIPKLVEVYNRSRIVLNHATDVLPDQFGSGYGYQCRHFEAGFAGTFLLSNESVDDDSLSGYGTFDSREDLVEKVNFWLKMSHHREEKARAFYETLHLSHLPVHRAAQMLELMK
jgi:hypothetical protein